MCHIHCGFYCSVLNNACCLIWHEILFEGLLFIRLQPGEVRLIICIHACHQFHIRTILICQVAVPCLAKVPTSPSPLFLTRRNMMICNMQKPCLFVVIITAYKIILGLLSHVTGWDRNIFISGNIHTFAVILLIIYSCCNRES